MATTPRPNPAPHWLLLAALLALAAAQPACQPQPDDDSAATARDPRRDLPPLDTLEADLHGFDPDRMRTALAHLAWAVDRTLAENPDRPRHRALLARAAIDLWLYAQVADTLAATAHDDEIRQRWLEELRTFGELLELVLATPGASPDDAAAPLGLRLATRLRPWLRPDLRDPARAPHARVMLTLLEAARATDPQARARAAHDLRLDPAAPLALQANLFLALRATASLEALRALPAAEHPTALARATAQRCPDLLVALDHAHTPDHAAELLRRRCGFACTEPDALLGLDTPTALPELRPDLEATCPLDALPPASPGRHQAFDNFLATGALTELARLRSALDQAPDGDPLHRIVAPFVQSFLARVDAAVVPGALPFVAADSGPDGLRLPRQRWTPLPIEPTAAVALVHRGALHLAAWPRYAAGDASLARSLVDAPELAFPGTPLLPTLRASATPEDLARVRDRLAAIDALPWPAPRAALQPLDEPATIALVADATTRVADLRAATALLADAGFARVVLVTWPTGREGALNRPVTGGIPLRIDTPARPTPTLRLADRDSALVDTLGRARELPIFEVERFLPDIYAAVLDFTRANPAIDELVLDPDDDLDLETLAMTLDALAFHRDGDVMASTEHLLGAPPLETQYDGMVPLVRPIYLAP